MCQIPKIWHTLCLKEDNAKTSFFMKQIKRRLINILNKELLIDKSLINENSRLEKNLSINPFEFNLLLYYFERDLNIKIPDEQININQNVNEFTRSIYNIKKFNNKMAKAS